MSKSKDNVRSDDIELWSRFKDEWWNPETEEATLRILHQQNPLRIQLLLDALIAKGKLREADRNRKDALKGIRILDVGCGPGLFSEALARRKATVVGVDAAEELCEVAREHIKLNKEIVNNVEYVCTTIEEYSDANPEAFDVVVCVEVLEHITDKKSFLKGCCKALKPGGIFLSTTWNQNWYSWIFGLVIPKALGLLLDGAHYYHLFISPHDQREILKEFKCREWQTRGIYYNILTQRTYFQKCTWVWYALVTFKDDK